MAKEKSLEIKKIDIMSLAKIGGLFGLIIGLIAGILITFVGFTGTTLSPAITNIGAILIVVLPLVYGVFYFICGAIGALIYNLIARKIGGIKVSVN